MTTYAFNDGVPASGDNPSADQPEMLKNNISTAGLIGVDHVGFNLSDGGYHTVIHFQQQVADPGAVALTGQLYTKQVTSGGNTDEALFYESGGGRITQLTTNPNGAGVVGSPTTNGWTTLPTGLFIQWGTTTAVTSGSFASGSASGTVTFSASNISFPNKCFIVIPNPFWTTASTAPDGSGTVNINQTTLSGSSFDWEFNSNSGKYRGFYWMAIGN